MNKGWFILLECVWLFLEPSLEWRIFWELLSEFWILQFLSQLLKTSLLLILAVDISYKQLESQTWSQTKSQPTTLDSWEAIAHCMTLRAFNIQTKLLWKLLRAINTFAYSNCKFIAIKISSAFFCKQNRWTKNQFWILSLVLAESHMIFHHIKSQLLLRKY